MILDSLILLASALLLVLVQIFSLISLVLPDFIQEAITYAISGVGYFTGIINIPSLLQHILIFINFIILFYTWHLIRWAYAHLPWFGKHHPHKIDKK